MTPIDPTVVIERMAKRLRSEGATHPVAGAVAVAARGRARLDQAAFAESAELPVDLVRSAEQGELALGQLPSRIGTVISATGADLLALADLEATWRNGQPIREARP